MRNKDRRPEHLGWVETALRTANPDLPNLRISAQSHYGAPDRIAFVDIRGVDDDRIRRRQIRDDAGDIHGRLGYVVQLEPGRDAYDVAPIRPASAHDRLRMLQCLRAAGDRGEQTDRARRPS